MQDDILHSYITPKQREINKCFWQFICFTKLNIIQINKTVHIGVVLRISKNMCCLLHEPRCFLGNTHCFILVPYIY